MKKINEEFLHFLWKYQHLTGVTFYTIGDFKLRVIDPGIPNQNSGPDFFNAKIEIDNTLWAGNVELHINSSDWIKHGHSNDKVYDTVILHVVYFNDSEITRKSGEPIPTAILRFPSLLWETYSNLQKSKSWIPCQQYLNTLEPIHIAQWTSSLMVQKLEEKNKVFLKNMTELHSYWDAILCRSIIRSFGLPVNTTPFEMLSLLVPYTELLRNKADTFALESILFGQAGMLDYTIPRDKYTEGLLAEFDRHKRGLGNTRVPNHIWKFMRMRPSSFPTLRIAQLAVFFQNHFPLMEKLESFPSQDELTNFFRIKAGDYWNTHYQFGKVSKNKVKYLGENFLRVLIINSIAPFSFFYGKINKNEKFCNYGLRLLEDLPPENNVILKNWGKFGIQCSNAFESQALLYLYKTYCLQKRCLDCQFGNNMIIDGRIPE